MTRKSWPFIEAEALDERTKKQRQIVFQTGYGPSGPPHIGTLSEVVRTSMVKRAFEELTGKHSRLICFSDDLDGMRKVPPNFPKEMEEDIGLPLSKVRDPFGEFDSFSERNNRMFQGLLSLFNLEYEFISSSVCYRSGKFDDVLLRVLENYEAVMEIMLPTLGDKRKETYFPFLPISPRSGKVLEAPATEVDKEKGTIVYLEPDGTKEKISVLGGNAKLQWKVDWAMRQVAMEVDYEMFGKDLIPSSKVGRKIFKVLKKYGNPPLGSFYEMFLNDQGKKISKTGEKTFSIEDWLSYASPESLKYFIYQKPKTQKRFYHEIVPKAVDDYHRDLAEYEDNKDSPIWHVHGGGRAPLSIDIPYSTLANISGISNSTLHVIKGYLENFCPNLLYDQRMDNMIKGASKFFEDRKRGERNFRKANEKERAALKDLKERISRMDIRCEPEFIQKVVYSVGRDHEFDPMKDWFSALYEILFGTKEGPRIGSFIDIYGIENTIKLIEKRLE